MALQIGEKMPAFKVMDETGNEVTDKDLAGKKTVIYFYPKDSTPGCTGKHVTSATITTPFWHKGIRCSA